MQHFETAFFFVKSVNQIFLHQDKSYLSPWIFPIYQMFPILYAGIPTEVADYDRQKDYFLPIIFTYHGILNDYLVAV